MILKERSSGGTVRRAGHGGEEVVYHSDVYKGCLEKAMTYEMTKSMDSVERVRWRRIMFLEYSERTEEVPGPALRGLQGVKETPRTLLRNSFRLSIESEDMPREEKSYEQRLREVNSTEAVLRRSLFLQMPWLGSPRSFQIH